MNGSKAIFQTSTFNTVINNMVPEGFEYNVDEESCFGEGTTVEDLPMC